MKYAILSKGQVENVIVCEPDFDPGLGKSKELFDPALHVKAPVVPTSIKVSKSHFLEELHTNTEELLVRGLLGEAEDLSFLAMMQTDPSATTNSGLNVVQLKAIRFLSDRMNDDGELDLLDNITDEFLDAVKFFGVYGTDETAANARITAIKANQEP